MKIEDFAGLVHVSVSSFHEHFKSVTSMSPLHDRKVLRLQEARRLMLSTVMDAGNASQRVGYLSLSQYCVKTLDFGSDLFQLEHHVEHASKPGISMLVKR
jgi:AraC-like DNA-binding protein